MTEDRMKEALAALEAELSQSGKVLLRCVLDHFRALTATQAQSVSTIPKPPKADQPPFARREDEPAKFSCLTNTNCRYILAKYAEGKRIGYIATVIQKIRSQDVREFLRFYGCDVPDPHQTGRPKLKAAPPASNGHIGEAIPKGPLPRNFLALDAGEKARAIESIVFMPQATNAIFGLRLEDRQMIVRAFPELIERMRKTRTEPGRKSEVTWIAGLFKAQTTTSTSTATT